MQANGDVNHMNEHKLTPICKKKKGHVKVASALMQANGDVNLMNEHKLTPLHMAFMGGHHGNFFLKTLNPKPKSYILNLIPIS